MSEFKPAEDYQGLLRQFKAMSMLIYSLEQQCKLQSGQLSKMAHELSIIGNAEIESQRQANEALTKEVERLEAAAADKWQPMATAPKNVLILLDVGGRAAQGIYSKVDEKWKYANLQIGLYMGKWEDVYFENEHTEIPSGWMPMPTAPLPKPAP